MSISTSLDLIYASLLGLWQDFLARLPLILAALVVVFITWLVNAALQRLLPKVLRSKRLRRGFRDLVLQLASVAVWLAGLTVAAVVMFPGMTPAKVLTGLGLVSIALGIAFKDVVENFLAGLLILWRFPFDPGDFVRVNDTEGQIEEITIRMTLIRKTDGELLILPNSKLFKEPVSVLTHRPLRRTTVICGVAYGEDVDAARTVIRAAVEACETVSREREVEIFAQEFADSSINFEVTWWSAPTPLDVRRSRDEVVAAVKRALDEAGIEIPFPYRTLTFKQPLRIDAERPPPGP